MATNHSIFPATPANRLPFGVPRAFSDGRQDHGPPGCGVDIICSTRQVVCLA